MSFRVGAVRVTPFAVDHSTYGCVAYLLEAGGRSLLYSGDLRVHGLKPGMLRAMIGAVAPRGEDVLLMEGTHLGDDREQGVTEYRLEGRIAELARSAPGLVLVAFAAEALADGRPEVVIGSSRGGAVAIRAAARAGVPLVLLAPAWRRFGVAPVVPDTTVVIHGTEDDVVPLDDSEHLMDYNELPSSSLIAIEDGHRLGSPAALAALLRAVAVVGRSVG